MYSFWMMKRVADFEYTDAATKDHVKERAKSLMQEWDAIRMFVVWEYSNPHLKMTDKDISHCCTYALGGTCTHAHKLQSCSKYCGCVKFFARK